MLRALAITAASIGLLTSGISRPSTAAESFPAVTDQRLLHAATDDGWLMFLRSYRGDGHAPFSQITAKNVGQLREVFTHDVAIPAGFEAPPIVNGRTMIVTTPGNHVYALNATNGKLLWSYDYPVAKRAFRTACCDIVNRGVALYGTTAYMATLDAHVVALDAATGKVKWNHVAYPVPGDGVVITSAPLALKGNPRPLKTAATEAGPR